MPIHSRPHTGRRILLISPYPPSRTGLAEYAAVFAAQCAARGFEVRVLAEHLPAEGAIPPPPPNVEVEQVWTRDLGGMRRMYLAARDDPAEVVHVSYSFTMFGGMVPGAIALVALGRLARSRPVVVTLHDVLPKRDLTRETLLMYHVRASPWFARMAVGAILKFLTRVADRIVVHGATAAATLENDYGVPSGKVAITEFPGYPAPNNGSVVAHEPAPAPTILYYGFLAPYKGVETLLTAFARARATVPDKFLRLVIAGDNHPRLTVDYAAELRDRARQLGLGPSDVEFPGYVDDAATARLFAQSSLVVLPYLKTAGASGTLATAMGADRPVVVTDLPTLVAQLNGYAKSRVIRPGDVSELAETLRSVAEGRFVPRPPRVAVVGGVRRWDDLVDRTADIYTSAIAARQRDFAGFAGDLGAEAESTI
ncbi:MAG: glycosyltransferase [Thermoplasmata archaeon]|nr:glycosyltransferase [Thermoplasmata archaeon]